MLTNQEMNCLTNRKLKIKPYLLKDNRMMYIFENELIERILELKDIDKNKISNTDKHNIIDECIKIVLSFHRKYLLHDNWISYEEYKKISANMIFYIDILHKELNFKDTVRMNNFDF